MLISGTTRNKAFSSWFALGRDADTINNNLRGQRSTDCLNSSPRALWSNRCGHERSSIDVTWLIWSELHHARIAQGARPAVLIECRGLARHDEKNGTLWIHNITISPGWHHLPPRSRNCTPHPHIYCIDSLIRGRHLMWSEKRASHVHCCRDILDVFPVVPPQDSQHLLSAATAQDDDCMRRVRRMHHKRRVGRGVRSACNRPSSCALS